METEGKFQILLSTYNGEKYLREQLDSYLNQTVGGRIKVLIRDDGSSDGTADILREYQRKYGFEVIFGENLGINRSLFELIRICDDDCQYFAMSDQDDVWLPDKLERAEKAMRTYNDELPVLYASRSMVTDPQLKPLGLTTPARKGVSFYNAAIQNICPGHTQTFNRQMLLELRNNYSDGIFVIDYWNYIVASSIGHVCFDNAYTVYHRQHGDNAVGYTTSILQKNIRRLKRLSFSKPDPSTVQLAGFYELYKDRISHEYQRETQLFLESRRFVDRLKFTFSMSFYRQSLLETLIFKILFLLGKYHI